MKVKDPTGKMKPVPASKCWLEKSTDSKKHAWDWYKGCTYQLGGKLTVAYCPRFVNGKDTCSTGKDYYGKPKKSPAGKKGNLWFQKHRYFMMARPSKDAPYGTNDLAFCYQQASCSLLKKINSEKQKMLRENGFVTGNVNKRNTDDNILYALFEKTIKCTPKTREESQQGMRQTLGESSEQVEPVDLGGAELPALGENQGAGRRASAALSTSGAFALSVGSNRAGNDEHLGEGWGKKHPIAAAKAATKKAKAISHKIVRAKAKKVTGTHNIGGKSAYKCTVTKTCKVLQPNQPYMKGGKHVGQDMGFKAQCALF